MSHRPCDIFRDTLASNYPDYGHALWEPSPGGLYNAVEVGDVGFIRNGRFHRLFNISLPGDHPSHQRFGVPECHEPLFLEKFICESTEGAKDFCSKSANLSHLPDVYASGPDHLSHATVSCPGEKRGTALSLPVAAQRKDTIAMGNFEKWIIKYIDDWFAFAKKLGLGINHMQDIILVTGRHCAKSWVNVAFTGGPREAEVAFGVQKSGVSGAGVIIEQRQVHGGAVFKTGPSGENLPENQCIFVRGFRVVRTLNIWPRLRGAGPTSDIGGHEPEPASGRQLVVEPIGSPTAGTNDPLHVLLQYIAEKAPGCDMALVHDDDLACIDGASPDSLNPDVLMKHLRGSMPEIRQAEIQYDSFPGNGSGSKPVVYTKVAMLSRDEIPPGATNLLSDAPNVNYDSGTTLDDVEQDAHAILVFACVLSLVVASFLAEGYNMWSSELDVGVNIIWIMSLVLNIITALFATFIRQRARSQNLGAASGRVNMITDMQYALMITVLLQYLSAVCFFSGLVIFLMRYKTAITIVLSIVRLIGVSYVMLLVAPSHRKRPSSTSTSLPGAC